MTRAPLARARTIWHTVRPLSAEQWVGLAFHNVRRRLPEWLRAAWIAPNCTEARFNPESAALDGLARATSALWPEHSRALWRARRLAAGRATLLGETVAAPSARDLPWRGPGPSRLWLYELHYLGALVPLAQSASAGNTHDLAALATLCEAWQAANPLGSDPGWEPYPLSLRLSNRLRAAALLASIAPEVSQHLGEQAATEACALGRLIESHLGANHLLANRLALALAVVCGCRGPGLDLSSLARLHEELCQQYLSDGGHIERSPMYHMQLTAWLSEVASAARSSASAPRAIISELDQRLRNAATISLMLRHPDGSLPFFNDTSNHTTAQVSALSALAGTERTTTCEQPLWTAPTTGYARAAIGQLVALMDCGPAGADAQPGHVHADGLSLELSAFGQRVWVNRGIRGYGGDHWRSFSRSVRAHNTAQFGEAEPCDFWGDFRVGRRSHARLLRSEAQSNRVVLSGEIRWETVAGRPTHNRTLRIDSEGAFVRDNFEGVGADSTWTVRYHFHPHCRISPLGAVEALIGLPGGAAVLFCTAHPHTWTKTPHFERFGAEEWADTCEVQINGPGAAEATLLLNANGRNR